MAAASASISPLAEALQDDVVAVTQHEAIIVRTLQLYFVLKAILWSSKRLMAI